VMEPYKEPRGTGSWLTLVLGALVFAVFGGVVGYAYVNGLPGMGGEPPLIRADAEPYRHAPSERGGLEVANSTSSIVNVLRPNGEPARVERLLPPETPMAVETPEPPDEPPPPPAAAPAPPPRTAAAAAPTVEPTPTPPPTAASPAPVPPPAAVTAPREPLAAAPAVAPPPAATVAADAPSEETPPAAAGAPVPVVKPDAPRQLAAVEPPSASVAAQPRRPAATQAAPAAEQPPPQRATPAAQRPAAQASPAAPAPQRQARAEPRAPAANLVGDVYRLQLVAVRTDAGLTQAWAQLRQRYPQALASVDPRIERTDTTSGPLYRLQAGPFRTREDAANACGNIRAGGGQCFIVGPVPQ